VNRIAGEIRVLHVVSAGEVGGAERMLVDLARRGPSTSVRHAVALFTPAGGALRAFFRDAGLEVHDAGPSSESPLAIAARTLGGGASEFVARAARLAGAHLIHVHTFASQALGTRAAASLALPLVRTEHSTRVYDDPSCWPFAYYSLEKAAAVVAISEHIAAVVRRRAPVSHQRVSIIPCGIDESRFPFAPPPAPSGPLRLVAVGRLDRRKGFDQAIEALREAPDVHLEIVGDGEERSALEAQLGRAGMHERVTLSGWLAEPAPAIARAEAALCSSRSEGLGLALLEAMSVGRPIVTVPVGGVVDFVRDGETGLVAGGTTVADLAAVLRRAAAARAALPRLGEAARAAVLARYTADAMATAYADLYRGLVPQ
jgi:glycosyltransferase involved in cell wall biosynthesis